MTPLPKQGPNVPKLSLVLGMGRGTAGEPDTVRTVSNVAIEPPQRSLGTLIRPRRPQQLALIVPIRLGGLPLGRLLMPI